MTATGVPPVNGTLGGRTSPALGDRLGPRRRRILDLLGETPGLNLDEVAQALGVQRTAAKHHLRLLERLGHVVRVHQGRHVMHFRAGMPPVEQEMFRLFRVPSVRRVAEALFLDGGRPREALAAELDVTPRTVRRAIRQLTRSGLARLERAPDGPRVFLHPRLRILIARQANPLPPPPPEGPATTDDTS